MNHTIRSIGVLASSALIGGLLAATAPSAVADDVNTAPVRRVTGDMTSAVGVARDAAGRVYVADYDGSQIVVHAKNANGASSALRVLSGAATTIVQPWDVAFDKNGFLYVANNNGNVLVFEPGANGDVPPVKTIGTGAGFANSLAFDSAGRLYVRKSTTVNVYSATASGSPAPTLRQITGIPAGYGLAVDGAGTTWVGAAGVLRAYSSNANGAALPLKTVTGANTTLGTFSYGIDTDSAKRVYVTNFNANTVAVFGPNANGNAAPVKLLGGAATKLVSPTGVSIAANGNLTVGNYLDDSYVEFKSLFPPKAKPKPKVKKPSKVRNLKVKGARKAKVRRVTWKAPKSNGGAKIQRYRITVKKGKKTLLRKTVKANKRSYKIKRGKLRKGKNVVYVQAKNKKGFSKNARKAFRVRK